jgi:lysozyme
MDLAMPFHAAPADTAETATPRALPGGLAALVLITLLTACSTASDPSAVLSPVAAVAPAGPTVTVGQTPGSASTVSYAPQSVTRFGDHDPFEFGARHPGLYPVHGIDVSKYQRDIDWQEVRRAGVAFAFLKATEGGDILDSRFHEYTQGARAAGIPSAPYHFYYFCTPARVQAAWYIANVPRSAVRLPPVLDMEWNHKSPTCKLRPDPATVRSEMKIWLDMVERHYGRKAIIYTTVDFHRENIDGHFRDHQFWLRSVAAHPEQIYPGHPWTFWQYTGTGKMPGIEGHTDINAFAGSRSQWQAWLKKHAR